ncbi:MAG: cyclic nucleotide-binding domain-containing protein [Gammaproteobacteria bacterium]
MSGDQVATATRIERPQRWDQPFDPNMGDDDVFSLLLRPEFGGIDASRFPAAAPLEGILKNDCRIIGFKPGDLIVREGDYGNSAFLILDGTARVIFQGELPERALGRETAHEMGWWQSLLASLQLPRSPEVRDTGKYRSGQFQASQTTAAGKTLTTSLLDIANPSEVFAQKADGSDGKSAPELKEGIKSGLLSEGALFGEIAALGRVRRTATIYAETPCQVLELRWQALRDIKARDETWAQIIDDSYRRNQLLIQLNDHPLLAGLSAEVMQHIADHTLFETYGSFEWHIGFDGSTSGKREEVVNKQGDYADGLLLIGGGFGRVTVTLGNGQRTITYLREGDVHGLDELYASWKSGRDMPLETSLSVLGYLHVLRLPFYLLAEHVFPNLAAPQRRLSDAASRPIADDSFIEWAVDERFINGTKTMLIDTERCVRCDDCVRACAITHNGNPRFIRHGKAQGKWMVANACMHCVDPVCMIGCPTGAIHRNQVSGSVVINDDTCIGCGTCANSCPYENIRLVDIRDGKGNPIIDPDSQRPIVKATKCDLCSSHPTGPACERACPHGALRRLDFQTELGREGGLS